MEWLQNEAIMTAMGAAIVVVLGVLVQIVRALGARAVRAIESWGEAQEEQRGLTVERRRREAADEIVAAVEQMHPTLNSEVKMQQALKLANEHEPVVQRETLEAALKRAGWRAFEDIMGPVEPQPEELTGGRM